MDGSAGKQEAGSRLECLISSAATATTTTFLALSLLIAGYNLTLVNSQESHQLAQIERAQAQAQAQAQHSACDRLFSISEQLAKYCLCKDLPSIAQLPEDNVDLSRLHRPNFRSAKQISQLSCRPPDLSTMSNDLASTLRGRKVEEEITLEIDYLDISTNITTVRGQTKGIDNAIDLGLAELAKLQVYHFSLQLYIEPQMTKQTSSQTASAAATSIEDQMIDFCGLINGTHLQFLSIFIEQADGGEEEASSGEESTRMAPSEMNSTTGSQLQLARLLSKFVGLNRLELSINSEKMDSFIESDLFRRQNQLKWLNLASNRRLKFAPEVRQTKSPFFWLTSLEYLSLESSQLSEFPLFSLFSTPFKLADGDEPASNRRLVLGLPNLTTLNLAGNRLKSFELDFFATFEGEKYSHRPSLETLCLNHESVSINQTKPEKARGSFQLPSLNQLDLSDNQFEQLTFEDGQYILCSMPNLNQLYLSRNRIKHVNLNSFIIHPTYLPKSMFAKEIAQAEKINSVKSQDGPQPSIIFSRLEYLDLSYNDLVQLTAFQESQQYYANPTRIRSINLSHNKLRKVISLFSSSLINRVIFKESFRYDTLTDAIDNNRFDYLESSFNLIDENNDLKMSLCDFLSPRSKVKPSPNPEESLLNEIILTNNQLTEISDAQFFGQQCKDIQILHLSRNEIQSIASRAFFYLINLEQLDLNSNHITEIDENLLMRSSKLRMLNLARNRIKRLNHSLFAKQIDLEELLLNENDLVELPDGLFRENNRLSILDLSDNRLTYLDETIFSHLYNLQVLNLNGNQLKKGSHLLFKLNDIQTTITKIRPSQVIALKRPDKLSKKQQRFNQNHQEHNNKSSLMKVGRNRRQANEMASNLFALAGNQLESFDQMNLDCNNQTFLLNVETILLQANRLRELAKDSFKCFNSIRKIYLQSNRLRFIEDSLLKSLRHLDYLDLSENQLTRLQMRLLPQSLYHLDLRANRLTSIQFSGSEMIQLESLDLADNENLVIDSGELVGFVSKSTSIRRLILRGIKQIEENKLNSTIQIKDKLLLELVDLSSTGSLISEISPLVNLLENNEQVALDSFNLSFIPRSIHNFKRLINKRLLPDNSMVHLDLSGNELDNVKLISIVNSNEGSGIGFSRLEILNLSLNIIDSWPFDKESARRFNELKHLDLSRNKLKYLINKNESSIGYTLPRLEYLNLSSNGVIGLLAQPIQNNIRVSLGRLMPQLKVIDLSSNRLTWIPMQFFKDLDQLAWLRLDNNQIESFPSSLLHLMNRRISINFDHNKNMRSLTGETTSGQQDPTTNYLAELGSNEAVLFSAESANHHQQLKCQQIDDYVDEFRRREIKSRARLDDDRVPSEIAIRDNGETTNKPDESSDNELCQRLLRSTRSISFNSIGSNASTNLNQNFLTNDNLPINVMLDLSLRDNDLQHFGPLRGSDRDQPDRIQTLIRLDLGDNKFEYIPETLCARFDSLMTLELSQNHLKGELKLDWISGCSRLTYLDLSANHLSSFNIMARSEQGISSSLLVLRLSKNNLSSLHGFPSYLFNRLRLLDLRFNHIKTQQSIGPQFTRPLLSVILITETESVQSKSQKEKPFIRINDNSMQFRFESLDNQDQKYSLSAFTSDGQANLIFENEKANQVVKFCRLNAKNINQICLRDETKTSSADICVRLKIASATSRCSTNLLASTSPTFKKGSNDSQPNSLASQSNLNASASTNEDPVLNFIDWLKTNWLRLKDMDMNEFLTNNLHSDSVWLELGDKYQIRGSTVIKVAIVIGAVCIVILLVAIFMLLTYFSGGTDDGSSESKNSLDDGSTSELTTVTTSTDHSSMMLNKRSSSSKSSSSNENDTSSGARTRNSLRSSQESSEQDRTVPELNRQREAIENSTNQHSNQLCSTPSSSLAPSSIETAETMQAVDSIQSGTPNIRVSDSVDQYHDIQQRQLLYGQQAVAQTATVMRMVKSNSANFESSKQTKQRQMLSQSNQYNTINSRRLSTISNQPNYSTLRSKMRQYNAQHQASSHLYSPSMETSNEPNCGRAPEVEFPPYATNQTNYTLRADQSTDPTTLSLLSLSSALSGNHFASQQVPPDAINMMDNQHNLCHYHSRIATQQQQSSYNNIQDQQSNNNGPIVQPEVILEQEEDQSFYLNDSSLLSLSVHNLPPPPPSPRAVEAMEQRMFNSNFYSSQK